MQKNAKGGWRIMASITAHAERKAAMEAAMKPLATRARSIREIESYLAASGYSEDTIKWVTTRLTQLDLLNDERFAAEWMAARTRKAIGAARMRREMRLKGIDDSTISALPDNTEPAKAAAVAFAEKTLRRLSGEQQTERRRKTVAALMRRGFTWEEADDAYREAERAKSCFVEDF